MIFHLLGYATLATELLGGAGVAIWLTKVGRRPWTWQRRVPVPKVVDLPELDNDPSMGYV
jgi:hypothetical protein